MLTARDATPDDYAAACELWRAFGADQPPPDRATWTERYLPHTLFFVDEHGERAGYALCVPYGPRGDIRHIMVTPAFRGRGIGRQLMAVVRDRLRAAGCTDWRLEVRDHNAAAVALYRSVGMDVLHVLVTLRMTRDVAARFGASATGALAVREVAMSEDAELEARYDLGRGQLSRARTVPSSILWRIDDAALAHYRRQLAPGVSHLFPFRAATADHAATLVAAAAQFGMEEQVELLVVGDAEAAPLVTAGAQATERMLEMGGAL